MAPMRLQPLLQMLDGIERRLLRHVGLGELGFEAAAAAVILIDCGNDLFVVFHKQSVKAAQVSAALLEAGVHVPFICSLLFLQDTQEFGGDNQRIGHGILRHFVFSSVAGLVAAISFFKSCARLTRYARIFSMSLDSRRPPKGGMPRWEREP